MKSCNVIRVIQSGTKVGNLEILGAAGRYVGCAGESSKKVLEITEGFERIVLTWEREGSQQILD